MSRALWVTPVSNLAGVARHFLDVAKVGLPGWQLSFLTPDGPLAEELRALGADATTGAFGPEAGLRASIRTLRKAIKERRPTVVHSHLSYADFVAAAGTWLTGVKLVSTEHGIAENDLVYHGNVHKARLMAAAHRGRLHRFDELIAVSQATKAAMRSKWGASSVHVVHNGVDPVPHAQPQPGLRLASIARLAPEKRIDVALNVFARLFKTHPEATFVIAGQGPCEHALRQQAADLGLGEAVRFVGYVSAKELLAETDVVVQLSVFENCSYTLLDALACEVGVCATPVGGNPEILPARCLAAADDEDRLVKVILEQGLHVEQRPSLVDWPSRRRMVDNVVRIYMS